MIERQAPPPVLFKYLQTEVYESYLSQGRVRLGVSSFYRREYESGAGFADAADGVRSASVPSVGKIVRTANQHFLFCFSRTYSYSMHALWLQRKDCGYDLCIALDGRAVLTALAQATKAKLGPRLMVCGACNYGEHDKQVGSLRGNLFEDAFLKPRVFAQEDEYRLAISLAPGDQTAPLDLVALAFPLAIKHEIRLVSPARTVPM